MIGLVAGLTQTYEVHNVAIDGLEIVQVAIRNLGGEALQNDTVECSDDFATFKSA